MPIEEPVRYYRTSDQRRDHDELLAAMDASPTIPPCTNYPDAFFPESNVPSAESQWAVNSCKECPLLVLCRDYGIKHERYGIWGGTTQYGRAQLRKKLNRLR